MSGAFVNRENKSKIVQERFLAFCISKNIQYAFSGWELLKCSDKFKDTIRNLDDETAKRIRYFPDLIIANKKSFLIELKNSKTIEKTAYDVYIGLSKISFNVGLVFLIDEKLFFCDIVDLRLKKSYGEIPIENDIWICPRCFNAVWTEKKYFEWKNKFGGSGTTYGNIDFKNTTGKFLSISQNKVSLPT